MTSAAKATGDDTACTRMMTAVHDLDTIIKRIRTAVLNPHDKAPLPVLTADEK